MEENIIEEEKNELQPEDVNEEWFEEDHNYQDIDDELIDIENDPTIPNVVVENPDEPILTEEQLGLPRR